MLPWTVIPNCHPLNGLAPQKWILSFFWRPEIQNRDISRAVFPPKALSRILLASGFQWVQVFLAYGCSTLVPASFSTWPLPPLPLWVCLLVCVFFYFYADHYFKVFTESVTILLPFSFLAARPVSSWLPNQGLNLHPLHWKGNCVNHWNAREVPLLCLIRTLVTGSAHQIIQEDLISTSLS